MDVLQIVAEFYLKELTPDALDTMLRKTPNTSNCYLGGMFTWYGTPEGHDYWSGIDGKYRKKFGYHSFADTLHFRDLRPYLEIHRISKELLAMERLKPWRQ
jgi:hypothetical protein